ncbi:hypothetical protein KKG58_02845 [Patescibacteria group bacterium]|nr:hypothetical protein [Patescibacteria group bacterium]
MANPKLILIDAQAVLHRAWHALPQLTDSQGRVTNAVYGFTALLLKLINEQKPDYLAIAFDTKAPTFRHKKYEEYKAGREKQPQIFYDQIDFTKNIIKSFDIPIFEKDGFEADDLIGAIIKFQKKKIPNLESLIVTGDLDLCQLIDKQTSVYFIRHGISQIKIYDQEAVKERFDLSPQQLIDYKSLSGDPSDNIKGVPGVGPKTALNLIKRFKNIEKLYQHLEKCIEKKERCLIKEPLMQLLLNNKKQVFLDKELVTIIQKIPGLNLTKLKCLKTFDLEKIAHIFQDFGFKSLINRLEKNGLGQQNKLF